MGQKTSILKSELAVKIMSAIASRTDGNYSTNIAEELGKSQPSISRMLTDLHTIGLVDNDCLKPALEGLKIYNQEKEFCGNIYTAMDQSIIETLE